MPRQARAGPGLHPSRRKDDQDQSIAVLAGHEAEQHFTGNANPEGARHDDEIAAELALHLEDPDVVDAYLEYL